MSFTAEIFIPDEKPKSQYWNLKVYGCFAIGLLAMVGVQHTRNNTIQSILFLFMFISFSIFALILFRNLISTRALNGIIDGNIFIDEKGINTNGGFYKFDEIRNFKIIFLDYQGEFDITGYIRSIASKRLAGTNNFIYFNVNDKELKFQIRLLSRTHHKEIIPIIKLLIEKKIITCKEAVSMLIYAPYIYFYRDNKIKKELGCLD